ncbi:MAG: helix-hairpin-helix domain-containing protein [Thermodesulfobacteriota bacterium]|jgi:hypothetical protein
MRLLLIQIESKVKDKDLNPIFPLMNKSIQDLQKIPGVGRSIAQDLNDLGVRYVKDLRNRNPERLYQKLCLLRGQHIDRCVLYVFRCAIYFAKEKQHEPHWLKWWNWKDNKMKPNKSLKRDTAKGRHVT